MNRRVLGLLGVVMALALFGCSRQASPPADTGNDTPSSETSEASGTTKAAGKKIAVVPKGMVHDFWRTVKAGADDAGQKEGVEILWKGPSSETAIAEQIAILEDFINQKVDAIVMAACDSKGLIPTVKKAVAAGIPVVTIDSGVDEDLAVSFVATDNPKGAAEAAKALAKLVGEKGTVGVIPFVAGAATSQMREQGFKDELKNHPGMKLGKVLYCESDVAKGMDAALAMLADPGLAGIFACNEPGAMGAAKALEQRGVAGKVKLVAFDASPAQITALKKGSIQALVVQNPFEMGFQGVMAAVRTLKGEKVEKRIDTGVTVVTQENLSDPAVIKILNPLNKPGAL